MAKTQKPKTFSGVERGLKTDAVGSRLAIVCGPYHVAGMAQSMILLVVVPSESGTKRVRISVPLVECLLDHQRYFLPGELPAPAGEELRPMSRPRITKASRAPSLRTLVKHALKCQSAKSSASG